MVRAQKAHPLFDDVLIACIFEDRGPSVHELDGLASRIWREGVGARSVFAWGDLPAGGNERRTSLRAAAAATNGFDIA